MATPRSRSSIAAIVTDLQRASSRPGAVELQHELTHRQVGLGVRAHHLLAELVSLGELAREDQAADLGQGLQGLGVVAVLRPARPERVVVERDPLGRHTAVDHGPQPAVADRQRLEPLLRRPLIPESQGLFRRHCLPDKCRISGLNARRQQQ